MKEKRPFQTILLMLLLVVLPLGSWLYLKKGFNYQIDAIAELKQYGKMPTFFTKDALGRTFSSDDLKGKLVLLNYISNTPQSKERIKTLFSLHEQFDDALGVSFINIGLKPNLENIITTEDVQRDTNQIFFIPTQGERPLFLGKEFLYPLYENYTPGDSLSFNPIEPEDLPDYPFFVLVDKNGTIRNFYPVQNKERIKRLVEHIALTMPRTIEPDPEIIRDQN